MKIDEDLLRRAVPNVTIQRASVWARPLDEAMSDYGITTAKRVAAFLAQVGHESMSFVYTREIWGPTAAQLKYEGRTDLGNTQKGDGSLFRGRGLIQITGRSNYADLSKALHVDFLKNPGLLEREDYAAESAAWWWAQHGCNALADAEDFKGLTRRINGGLNGIDDRQFRYNRARTALGL